MKRLLKKVLPASFYNWLKVILKPSVKYGWFGDYSSWSEAKQKCSGYDDEFILRKVIESTRAVKKGDALYERDSVLFYEENYSEPLIDCFTIAARENNGSLFVIDFGGALGSTWHQNKTRLLSICNVEWCVVEQPHFVKVGATEFSDEHLSFYPTIEAALSGLNKPAHVLLLSSVLPYIEEPYRLIHYFIEFDFPYIIIDRTAFVSANHDILTIQVVPESIYKASYPAWFFNEERFKSVFTRKYDIVEEFPSAFDDDGILNGRRVYRKGFLLKRKI